MMKTSSSKSPIRQLYQRLIYQTRVEYSPPDFQKSAIVFAPHQDDETLGCGGTIIRKKQAGAEVKVVFMTDGGKSHAHLISEDELKSIRAQEALAAAQKLGLSQTDILFLEVPDGTLANHQEAAIQKVAKILLKYLPEEIFVPYHQDGISDHNATAYIVLLALRRCGFNSTVYEYPIWFFNHWPWTPFEGDFKKFLLTLSQNIKYSWRFLKEFKSSVYIGEVLDQKRSALEEHKSQVTQLILDPQWLTLRDVSQGDFLDCFFQNYELFRSSHLNKK
ncbi:PIG-L deacetylase family protein [Limnoraphis robusta]|nr:PIG-L family deacetylase [Limnoraphis robusta]